MQTPKPTDAAGQPATRLPRNEGEAHATLQQRVDTLAAEHLRLVAQRRQTPAPRAAVPAIPKQTEPEERRAVKPAVLSDRAQALLLVLAGAAIGGFVALVLRAVS